MPQNRAILVTGGAGYIGSHVVKQLVEMDEQVVVLDNLSNGHRDAVREAEFIEGDVRNSALVRSIMIARRIESVMHFAASTVVSESVENPAKYYANNTGGTAALLECANLSEVKHFIFSSTAAVYGAPEGGICDEDSRTDPINPYGRSKLMSEQMIRDVSTAREMSHVILRYFNVAGAEPGGLLGQRGKVSTHITKIACEAAVGLRDKIEVFGTDYPTDDGTCIRDYVHVVDLASAHVAALKYLRAERLSTTLNCGYGKGYSVREVIRAVEKAGGCTLKVVDSERRFGDPPVLIAAVDRISRELDWTPRYDSLSAIAKSALAWEQSL